MSCFSLFSSLSCFRPPHRPCARDPDHQVSCSSDTHPSPSEPSKSASMLAPQDGRTLTVGPHPQFTIFSLTDTALRVQHPNKQSPIETPYSHVLWAGLEDGTLEVSFLHRPKTKAQLSLLTVHVQVSDQDSDRTLAFTALLMENAYAGSQPRRRLMVLVNPNSGPGNAVPNYFKKVEPVFRTAHCSVNLTHTTRKGHATELMKMLPLPQYDAVVAVSGDGVLHEIINGFAEHAEPLRALRMPLAPIPSGSGNGLAISLLGLQDGEDIVAAALNAVKGQPMDVDVSSVTQMGQRTLSFMSQTVGLFADVDLKTEHLRFIGSTRFVIGFINEVVKMKPCPVKLSLKIVETDKEKMVHTLHTAQDAARARHAARRQSGADTQDSGVALADKSPVLADADALPPLQHTGAGADTDGWTTFDAPIMSVYAGKGPYVSRDLMHFPVSIPDDGCIDVVVQKLTSRKMLLQALNGSEHGQHYWSPMQQYMKATAYRVEPYAPTGCLSIDGEGFPFEPFEVEVHKGLGRLLSPCGYYQAEFNLPKKK